MAAKNWRDKIKIHPAAELFPQMTPSELRELGEDIKANGMRVPITLLQTKDDDHLVLLDGRNRLDALVAAGCDLKALFAACKKCKPEPQLKVCYVAEKDVETFLTDEEVDPYEYVVSLNINRRHLTSVQKGELIAALLKAQPERSDRATAQIAKVDHKTIAGKRAVLERTGEIPQSEMRVGANGIGKPAKKKKTEPKRNAAPSPQAEPAPEPSTASRPSSEPADGSENAISYASTPMSDVVRAEDAPKESDRVDELQQEKDPDIVAWLDTFQTWPKEKRERAYSLLTWTRASAQESPVPVSETLETEQASPTPTKAPADDDALDKILVAIDRSMTRDPKPKVPNVSAQEIAMLGIDPSVADALVAVGKLSKSGSWYTQPEAAGPR